MLLTSIEHPVHVITYVVHSADSMCLHISVCTLPFVYFVLFLGVVRASVWLFVKERLYS